MPGLGLGVRLGAYRGVSVPYDPATSTPGLALWLPSTAPKWQDNARTTPADGAGETIKVWDTGKVGLPSGGDGVPAGGGNPNWQTDGVYPVAATFALSVLTATISLPGKFTFYASGTTSDTNGTWFPIGVHSTAVGIGLYLGEAFVRTVAQNATDPVTIPAGAILGRWRRDTANDCYYRGTNQAEILIGNNTATLVLEHLFAWFVQYNAAAATRYQSMLLATEDLVTDYASHDAGIQAWFLTNDGRSM